MEERAGITRNELELPQPPVTRWAQQRTVAEKK